MTASEGVFPDAHYLILASRLVPDRDGGFVVAVLARAAQMAAAGADGGRGPLLLTVDPAFPAEHARQRERFVERGMAASVDVFRNLFDDAIADPTWLRAAAAPGEPTPGVEYRTITDAEGAPVLSLPVVDSVDWHLTEAHVVVHATDGDRVLPGFRGLYRAWLGDLGDRLGSDGRPVVLICEARQLGELLAGWRRADVCLVHTVHTSHLGASGDPEGPVDELWRRWFAVAGAFDAVVWPTLAQRADAVAAFGARAEDAVVPNAPPMHAGAASPLPGRVAVVGRLAPGKRVDHVLRAWSRVVREVPEARLDLYGDGPTRAELERLTAELGLEGSVCFHGHVPSASAAFATAALTVQASAYEGQGLSVLESIAWGCPVVAYDVRYGPRELLGTGAGVLVADGDVDALATAIVSVLRDAALRESLSARARAHAASYAPERVMAQLGGVVRRALARRGAGRSDGPGSAVDEFVLPL